MIINYATDSEAIESNQSTLLPTFPFRGLVVGPSGCGKTMVVLNLVINNDLKLDYDRVYVISSTLHQSAYVKMEQYFEEQRQECVDRITKSLKSKKATPEQIEEVTSTIQSAGKFYDDVDDFNMEDLDPTFKNLVIIDDFVLASNNKLFKELFVRGRHYNASPLFIGQSYFQIPKIIRDNSSFIILFGMNCKEISRLCYNVGDLDIKTMQSLFSSLPRYEFITIDHRPILPELKYRRNLDTVLKLK